MSFDLSPDNSQYLAKVVADGLFPSVDAALDAAVDALRRQNEQVPMVPDEHMDAVEEALADLEAGIEEDMTTGDWDELRQIVRDAAAKQSKAN